MRKLRTTAAMMTMVVVVFSLIGVYLVLDNLTNRASEGRDDRADLRQEITSTRADLSEQQAALGEANAKLASLGKSPIPTPSTLPSVNLRYIPIPGPPGKTVVGPKGDTVVGPKGDSIIGPPGASIKGDTGGVGPAGPPAKDGTNGTNGTDAPTVTNITCDATTGVFTFSNDNTIRVDNMCAPPLTPAP